MREIVLGTDVVVEHVQLVCYDGSDVVNRRIL